MIGVLRTRDLPNSAASPSVHLKTPPYSAMSWPRRIDPRIAGHRLAQGIVHGVDVAKLRSRATAARRRLVRNEPRRSVHVGQLALGGRVGIGKRQRRVRQIVDRRP